MKVYRAHASFTFYVAAESDEDAEDVAEEHLSEALTDGFADVETSEIRAERTCGADLKSIPYGENERTIEQILAQPEPIDPDAEPQPPKDEWTLPMFPSA